MTRRLLPLFLLIVAGCPETLHRPMPPQYTGPTDVAAERAELVRRAGGLRTVGGSGSLTLTRPDGQSVVLDVVVAYAAGGRAHVRASKFGHTVFDLTVRPDGAWLAADADDRATAAGLTGAQVARGLSLLAGGFFDDPAVTAVNRDDHTLVLTRPGTPSVVCEVDRQHLLTKQFELVDAAGHVPFRMSFLGSVVDPVSKANWPWDVEARADDGSRAEVKLDQTDLNADLPATAFDPPPRARRLP